MGRSNDQAVNKNLDILAARLEALDDTSEREPVVLLTPTPMHKAEPETVLLTLQETARQMRVTTKTLYNLKVPMIRLSPRCTRVSRAALTAWLAERAGQRGAGN